MFPVPPYGVYIILKIPFEKINDPLIEARKQAIADEGRNGFTEYYEPLAAIAIKQGFGRLIRKATDQGIAVLLDERLINKTRLRRSLPVGVNIVPASPDEIYRHLTALAQSLAGSIG